MRVLLVLAVVAVTFVTLVAAGCNPTAAYTSGYTNVDSTYYGPGGGQCSLNPTPTAGTASGIYATAAIGDSAWGGSQACGMCVNISYRGTGSGANPPVSGSILFIDNRCPECGYGLDIGKNGFDGRWKIDWKAVPCPVGSTKFQFVFQGSHEWYIKLQVRNTRYPVASLAIVQNGVVKSLERQSDNFWTAGSTVTFPITVSSTNKLELRITSVFGDTVTDYVSEISTTVRDGTAQFPDCGGSSSGSAATSTTSAKSSTTTTTTTTTTSSKSTTSTSTTSSKSTTSTTGSKSTTSTTRAPSTSTSAKAATTTTTGKAATTTTTGKAATTGTGSTTGSTVSGTDVYLDDVVSPIQDWSWGQVTRQSTAVTAFAGTKCYELKPIDWAAVYFRYFDSNGGTSFTSSLFKSLEFYIRSPTSAPVNSLQFAFVVGSDGQNPSTQYMSGTNIPSAWTKVTITVPSGSSFTGFWIQDADSYDGGPKNADPVYFDNFRLLKA